MENETQIIQTVSSDSLSLITKAEIDVQISTAKAFPRSLKESIDRAKSMATISQEVAESCIYALPRGGKTIEGPSVRLAEIIASSFGNMRSGARVIANDGKKITAQGICHDLETNNCVTVEVERRITGKNGKTFNEDMQIVTGNASCAIAFRNAVFKVIPSAIIDTVYQAVKDVARGTQATLETRRSKAIEYFKGLGVSETQICETLDIKKIEDVDLDKLQILTGFKTAITNGDSTASQIFAKIEDETPRKKISLKDAQSALSMKTATIEQLIEKFDIDPKDIETLKKEQNEQSKGTA